MWDLTCLPSFYYQLSLYPFKSHWLSNLQSVSDCSGLPLVPPVAQGNQVNQWRGAYLGQPGREGRASSQSQSLAFRWAAARGQRGTWPIWWCRRQTCFGLPWQLDLDWCFEGELGSQWLADKRPKWRYVRQYWPIIANPDIPYSP